MRTGRAEGAGCDSWVVPWRRREKSWGVRGTTNTSGGKDWGRGTAGSPRGGGEKGGGGDNSGRLGYEKPAGKKTGEHFEKKRND